jgi:hypothetical protein
VSQGTPRLTSYNFSILVVQVNNTAITANQGAVSVPGNSQVPVMLQITNNTQSEVTVYAKCSLLLPDGEFYNSWGGTFTIPATTTVNEDLPIVTPSTWNGTSLLSAFLLDMGLTDELAEPVGGYRLRQS